MSFVILKAGFLTTVQDTGRHGFQHMGVSVTGAADSLSLRIANLLCGNQPNAAGLEMTLTGADIRFEEGSLIALCGADMSGMVNGKPAPLNRPLFMPKGSMLKCGAAKKGCRQYMAVAGGVETRPFLGSRSTDLRLKSGGHEGRALKKGDILKTGGLFEKNLLFINKISALSENFPAWFITPQELGEVHPEGWLRFIPGPEYGWFDEKTRRAFFSKVYMVTNFSDRMGLRLSGERIIPNIKKSLISEGTAMGTVQIPDDGQPIILTADRQTTGGYPKIAQLITADLPAAAQLKPGDRIRFLKDDIQTAEKLLENREKHIKKMETGVMQWLKLI